MELKTLTTDDAGKRVRMNDEECVIEQSTGEITLEVGDKIDPTRDYDYGVRYEITNFDPDEGKISYIDGHIDEEVTERYYMLTTALRYNEISKDYIRSRGK